MLPLPQKILFLLFAAIMGAAGFHGFRRLYRRIAAGRQDTEPRTNQPLRRLRYSLSTTLTQCRTFRKRPWVSFFHSLIFYGFVAYLLVNLIDALEGFVELPSLLPGFVANLYVLAADLLSAGVLFGVVALVLRRFLLPSRRDFRFNERTLLHQDIRAQYIARDSILVSAFILFHVGSRAIGAGAKLASQGPDRFAPFATLLSHLFTPQHALAWRIFGYWGALGSVLAFLVYFPYSKHIHIFLAPAKYFAAQSSGSGVLPAIDLDMDAEEPKLGANKLEDLAWPRLLDAYACIQCNRCQDVCPATATGKSLSPSALEINKRMELNDLAHRHPAFELGQASPNPLLSFALSPQALWACTTCGACLEVCPVQDEPMLDVIDIRRHQVMIEGEFPAQLQSAFRGMERAKNPWGIGHEKRMDWAAGLNVPTIEQNPQPDVLFWVGCAPSYDPQSQKTARALVQLLDIAKVNYAVLGKQECCTGDSARRAGNEYLYRQLADTNVATLNEVRPKLVVTTCPHCMNALGKEYKQIGGDFKVIHHTEYLESLVNDGKLSVTAGPSTVAYHDPCYLGRHNGVYDAPRNLLNILSNSVVELPRSRENSFCCGAGGAQFWKEEEEGDERISENRYREAEERLKGADDKVLAVGCPFCKSMLESTPTRGPEALAVRDVAELLLEGVQRNASRRTNASATPATLPHKAYDPHFNAGQSQPRAVDAALIQQKVDAVISAAESIPASSDRTPFHTSSAQEGATAITSAPAVRKAWTPKPAKTAAQDPPSSPLPEPRSGESAVEAAPTPQLAEKRKAWTPKPKADN
jgi:Fe-S oxidoreductase